MYGSTEPLHAYGHTRVTLQSVPIHLQATPTTSYAAWQGDWPTVPCFLLRHGGAVFVVLRPLCLQGDAGVNGTQHEYATGIRWAVCR